jgi:hypothetical protein
MTSIMRVHLCQPIIFESEEDKYVSDPFERSTIKECER